MMNLAFQKYQLNSEVLTQITPLQVIETKHKQIIITLELDQGRIIKMNSILLLLYKLNLFPETQIIEEDWLITKQMIDLDKYLKEIQVNNLLLKDKIIKTTLAL